jgi:hypothetical protein
MAQAGVPHKQIPSSESLRAFVTAERLLLGVRAFMALQMLSPHEPPRATLTLKLLRNVGIGTGHCRLRRHDRSFPLPGIYPHGTCARYRFASFGRLHNIIPIGESGEIWGYSRD